MVLALSVAVQADLRAEAKSDSAPAGQIRRVFDIDRGVNADLVVLDTGPRLAGTILNESVILRAGYGSIEVERRWIAGIRLAGGTGGLESLITVHSNRFSGFVETPSFSFLPDAGSRIDLRREKVVLLIFGTRGGALPSRPGGRWFGLRNGDVFSGRVLRPDPLSLTTASAPERVKWAEAAGLTFPKPNSELAQVILRAGGVLQGTVATEDFEVELDTGSRIQIYRNGLAWIGDSTPGASVEAPPSTALELGRSPQVLSPGANCENLVWIPPGEFMMGSPSEEVGRNLDEGPQTRVVLPQGFWMGRCEVNQAEYQQVMGSNPSNTTDDPRQPVEKVTWFEAMEYCRRLTQRDEASGRLPNGFAYRLPTEAEWEYACRAGTKTRFSFGDDQTETQLTDYSWFLRNSDSTPHPVGKKLPNAWGLYDMHGNVWEWCLDRWESALPGACVTNNPTAAEGTLRVARGGSWLYDGRACRSANRDDYSPSNRCSDLGFRVALARVSP